MKDHPWHHVHILGGMWGFKTEKNREMAKRLFNIMINLSIAPRYNFPKNDKGKDQDFLRDYFYPYLKDNSLVHDSFYCNDYHDSEPFPTQRVGSCFVGASLKDTICQNSTFLACPIECRPKDHQDWIYC